MRNELQRILVGADFSTSAGQVLSCAARLASLSGAELEVIHVATGERSMRDAECLPGRAGSNDLANRLAELQMAALQLGAKFAVPVQVHLAHGTPHVEIAARAAVIGANLLVLGAHGKRALRAMFLGS